MTTELDEGPDPNDLRRHAKRMFTELQYRQKYRRLDFYKPNLKQEEFHNTVAREVMIRAGNQEGKTHAVGAQMTFDALRWYPEWYKGRRFLEPPKIERPYQFLGWAACTTSAKTRDGAQTKLLGDLTQGSDALGTGFIPLDNIPPKGLAMARGIADFVDSVTLIREGGGTAVIRFKSYDMGRRAFEVEAVDEIWLDEDIKGEPPAGGIYPECLARLTTTAGQIRVSMTPVLGLTPVRRRFKEKHPGTREILMTIDDALVSKGGHIPDERLPELLAQYKTEADRQTKLYGADAQGEGAVFETPVDRLKHARDPATFPRYWPWLWGFDFRHSGSATSGHPFAAVLAAHDRDNDIIYIVHAVRMFGLAPGHVVALKKHPMWMAPVAWPHDGGRGASLVAGETVAQVYKGMGMRMRPTHATFPDGGFNFEAGISVMAERFDTGRLKVAAHLAEWFDEYQGYHRINGLVNKVDDDLLSATRQVVMDIRHARTMEQMHETRPAFSRPGGALPLADGIDFDYFAV